MCELSLRVEAYCLRDVPESRTRGRDRVTKVQ